jgi:hypothetical protein
MKPYPSTQNNKNLTLTYIFKQIEDITFLSFSSIIRKDLYLYTPYSIKIYFNHNQTGLEVTVPKTVTILLQNYDNKTCKYNYGLVFSTIDRWYRYNAQGKSSITLKITNSY